MPLALLLQKFTGALVATARSLAPWTEIVTLESAVVERVRSIFLAHWFGAPPPIDGLALLARVMNTDELDARFAAARSPAPTGPGGLQLAEPLSGLAGMVAGMVMSPLWAVLGAGMLLRFGGLSWATLVAALVWVAVPFLLGLGLREAPAATVALAGGGLVGGGVGLALVATLSDRREVREAYDLLGAAARCLDAAVRFLERLTGPRTSEDNPLLARLLALGDRLAALFAQLLGTVAFLVLRVGPTLVPSARTLAGLGTLARDTVTVLTTVGTGLLDRLDEVRTGPLSFTEALQAFLTFARKVLTTVGNVAAGQLGILVEAARLAGTAVADKSEKYAGEVGEFVTRLFTEHPVVRTFVVLKRQMDVAVKELAKGGDGPSEKPSGPSLWKVLLPPVPDFPALPAAPDPKQLRRALGSGSLPALDADAIVRAAEEIERTCHDVTTIELGPKARAALTRAEHPGAPSPTNARLWKPASESPRGSWPSRQRASPSSASRLCHSWSGSCRRPCVAACCLPWRHCWTPSTPRAGQARQPPLPPRGRGFPYGTCPRRTGCARW